jgi:hypothetical protein
MDKVRPATIVVSPGAVARASRMLQISAISHAQIELLAAGVGTQPVSLLNDQSHLAAPCDRRDPAIELTISAR